LQPQTGKLFEPEDRLVTTGDLEHGSMRMDEDDMEGEEGGFSHPMDSIAPGGRFDAGEPEKPKRSYNPYLDDNPYAQRRFFVIFSCC
jgi:hypothetical protein